MAIDAQVLNLIREQDKRQSNYRQVSRDYMRNTNKSINSLDSNVRYSIEQTNALRSGLGEVTGKILSQIKNSSRETINQTTKGNQDTDKALKADNATIVQKLESIRGLMESQRDIVRNYINGIKKTNSYEDETNTQLKKKKLTEIAAKTKKDNKIESNKSSTAGMLSLAGLAAIGAGLLLEPFMKLTTALGMFPKIYDSAASALGAIKNTFNSFTSWFKGAPGTPKTPTPKPKPKPPKKPPTPKPTPKPPTPKPTPKPPSARPPGWRSRPPGRISSTAKSISQGVSAAAKSTGAMISKAAAKGSAAASKTASATAKTVSAVAKGTANTLKTVGKVAGAIQKVPGVKMLAKGAGIVGAGMEVYEAGKLLTMDPKERQKVLEGQTEEFLEKGALGRVWYSFTNNSKTIAMALQTNADRMKLNEETRLQNEINAQKEIILERKKAQKELENTPEARQKKLAEMGDLKKLNFMDFESTGDLQSYLSTAEGRKYYEQMALQEGISKKEARAKLVEQYKNFDFDAAESQQRILEQENVMPSVTLQESVDKNTETFETLTEELREFISNANNNVMVSSSTNISAPGADYGERQRQMIAG